MTDTAKALAAADQDYAAMKEFLTGPIEHARHLLAAAPGDEVRAWATIHHELMGVASGHPNGPVGGLDIVAGMLAAAVIRAALRHTEEGQ